MTGRDQRNMAVIRVYRDKKIYCSICGKIANGCVCGYTKHLGYKANKETTEETTEDLSKNTVKVLKVKCKELGLSGYSNKDKDELIEMIEQANA